VAFILLLLLIQAIPNTNKGTFATPYTPLVSLYLFLFILLPFTTDENPQPDSVGLLPKCHVHARSLDFSSVRLDSVCMLLSPTFSSSLYADLTQGRTKADSKCYSLFYLPNDNPEINAVMTTLADRNKLNISTTTELSPKVRAGLSLCALLCACVCVVCCVLCVVCVRSL